MFGKNLFFACTFAALATKVVGSGIIFPLYVDPGKNCKAWTSLTSQIAAFPDLPWYIIINPDSGPGTSPPSNQYQTCVPTLRPAGANVVVLGYVDTDFTDRSTSDIEADVSAYASWGAAYRPNGIFFDDVTDNSKNVATYQSYATFARNSFASFVVLNPGTTPSTGYYGVADLIVTFEDEFSNFDPSDLTISSSAPASKQAVILIEGPSTPPSSTITELAELGIQAVYFTDDGADGNPYDSYPSNWAEEVQEIAAA